MNARVRAVVGKELREFRRNKFIVGTMSVLPLVFLVPSLGNLLSLSATTPFAVAKNVVGAQTLVLFLLPLILPTVIAAYAVIGERDQGTLEPVLTTPISGRELLLGKAIAAILPSVAVAYLLYAVFLVAVWAAAAPVVRDLVFRASFLVAGVSFVPLLAAFSTWVALAISVRSNDVRVAQQLSAVTMLPVIGLIALFTFRVLSPTVGVALAGAALLLGLDSVAWRIVSRMFDRERLLTRYGKAAS